MSSVRKRRIRYGFGLMLVPFSLWGMVVALAPMDWARGRVASALSQAVGQPVRLGELRLGLLGGIRVLDLEIGQPGPSNDLEQGPWLRADEIRVDISPLQLLAGRVEPTSCRATGVSLRVLRGADGRLEIADLLKGDPETQAPDPSDDSDEASTTDLVLQLAKSRVLVIDVPTETRLELTEVQGRGLWGPKTIAIEDLSGSLNGGRLALAARLDRGEAAPAFEGEVRVSGTGLDGTLGLLAMVVPSLAGPSRSNPLEGRLDLDVRLKGRGATSGTIKQSLKGEGSINLHDVALDQTRLFAEIVRAFQLPTQGRVGSLQGHFVIADRRVATRDLTLRAGSLPIRMAGWTDFAGQFDYRLHADELADRASSLASRLPAEYREPLGDLPAMLGQISLLRLQGGPQGLRITADGNEIGHWVHDAVGNAGSREIQDLRELGRRIRSRVLR